MSRGIRGGEGERRPPMKAGGHPEKAISSPFLVWTHVLFATQKNVMIPSSIAKKEAK